jgi:hypothetical protein
MKINAESENGGAVVLNEEHNAWASYSVADMHDNLFYAGITMKDGHSVQFFVNRETGLVVVDYNHKNDKGGNELLRKTLNPSTMLAHCERKKRTA